MANIIIRKDSENVVIMSLGSRLVYGEPSFLIHFQSNFNSSEERFVSVTDISDYKIRYDEFLITETPTPDYNNNEVDLFVGEWKYDVYESSASTLSISATTGVKLTTGLAIII